MLTLNVGLTSTFGTLISQIRYSNFRIIFRAAIDPADAVVPFFSLVRQELLSESLNDYP